MADDTAVLPLPAKTQGRRTFGTLARIAIAERHGAIKDGSPHPIECAYCRKPGTVTMHPPGTRVRTYWCLNICRQVPNLSTVVEATLEFDHIVPYSRGGKSVAGNGTFACSSCNVSKADRTVREWWVWLHTKRGQKSLAARRGALAHWGII